MRIDKNFTYINFNKRNDNVEIDLTAYGQCNF